MGRICDLGRLFLTTPLTRLADLLNATAPSPWEERVRIYREALGQAAQIGRPQLEASLRVSLAQELLDDRSRSRAESLEEAIVGLEEAIRIFRAEGLKIPWAEACTSLAIVFLERIRGRRQDNLEEALRLCRRALQVQSRRARPLFWAEVVDCLAGALAARARPPRAVYLEKSLDLFRRALVIRKQAPDPDGWVNTSINLAKALQERIRGDRAESLEEAIGILRNAEQAMIGRRSSPQWAKVRINLAVTYREHLRGDPIANREQAINILTALLEQKEPLAPLDRGRALQNRAVLYAEPTRGGRAKNLKRAIEGYWQALEIHTREDLPRRWVETAQNLATAYAQLPEGDPAENLERAITLYRQVLDQIDRDQALEDWAVAASNLATACSDRAGEEGKQSLKEAVRLYRQVLEVRRDVDPRGWALTQMNLGNAFARLELYEEPEAFEAARDAYRQALEVHRISTLPGEHRRTQGNLADLFFARQSWQEALDAYRSALAAGEIVYRSAATPEARRATLRANLDFSSRAAWCLARLGRPGEAVEILERSRTRNLNEALGFTEAQLQRLPTPLRTALSTTWERIASLEAQSLRLGPEEREEFLRITESLGGQRAHLDEVLERSRQADPGFLPDGMSPEAALVLAGQIGAPWIYLLTTAHGSLALLVAPGEISPLFFDRFQETDLRAFIHGTKGETPYLQVIATGEAQSLQEVLDRCVPLFEERLLFPLAEELTRRGIRQACLVPCGSLGLLPLAALAPEDLVLHISPSARALEAVQARLREARPPRLVAAGDPPSNHPLAFAAHEAREIAELFPPGGRQVFLKGDATLARVRPALREATHLHLSCHGHFRFDEPLRSAIELAGGEPWLLQDLFDPGLDLASLRLVVLSACQTGITDQELPDEALGFPAAFQKAGVPAVVSALWPVDDRPTALLLIRFYHHHLSEKMEPARALREAQKWLRTSTVRELRLVEHCERILRESRSPHPSVYTLRRRYQKQPDAVPFAHPYFWAGFVVHGM